MLTEKAIAAFLTSRKARNLSPKTLEYYRWCLSHIADHHQVPTTPVDLELILGLATGHLAPQSVQDLWRGLRVFYRWLGLRYQVPNPIERLNPYGQPDLMVPAPRVPPQLPRVLSTDQVSRLIDQGCQSRRDRAMVLIILDTGIRLSEVASIDKEQMSPDVLRVNGKRGVREVPITHQVLVDLLTLGTETSPWTTRNRDTLTRAGIEHAYKRIFARAKVNGAAQSLRHTFATQYLRRGGNLFNLQRILGHSDIKTTMVYVHLVNEDLIRDHQRVSPVLEWL